jgi:hypothetical protein
MGTMARTPTISDTGRDVRYRGDIKYRNDVRDKKVIMYGDDVKNIKISRLQ